MPHFRNGVVCLAALLAGTALALGSLQSPRVSPAAVQARPTERRERAVPPSPASRVNFATPTRQPAERRLEPGTIHVYPLLVKRGRLLELIVDQDRVDLQVSVRDTAAGTLFIVDSPNGSNGPERVFLAPKESTSYRLEVSGRGQGKAGRYQIRIAAERPASERDRMEAEAEKLFHQGKEAMRSSDSEPKLAEATRLWGRTRNLGRQADALAMLGLLYRQHWQWQSSLETLLRAKAIFHRLGRFRDEGVAANDIGLVYEQLSGSEEARASYQEALTLGARSESPEVRAIAFYNLGNLARRQSRLGEALENLERAREIWKERQNPKEIEALSAIGGVFAEAGEIERALPRFKHALTLAVSRKDLKQQAVALAQMGNALWRRDPDQAQRFFRQATEIQRRLGDLDDLAVTLNGYGLLLLSQKRYQEALDSLEQALRIYKQKNSPLDQARTLTNLGFTFAGLGRGNDARAAYETAISQARDHDAWIEAAARSGLARLEEQLGNPIEARNHAEAAVRCVENMRTSVRPDLRISFLSNRQNIYDTLIEVLLWQHELNPSAGLEARAFEVSEQARTRGLLDSVSGLEKSDLPPPEILSLHRSVIDPGTLLLEYHLGRKASFLWLVDRTSLQVLKLPPREKIEGLVKEARRYLPIRARDLSAARRAATALSRALLKPAAPWLGRKRLAISAPDLLQGIPFGVLPDPEAPDSHVEREGWPNPLILNHEIVKVPSITVLAALQERDAKRSPPRNLLAILADPVFEATDERFGNGASPAAQDRTTAELGFPLGRFVRLRYAADEAKAILRETGKHGVLTAFGFDANRDFVLKGNLRNFRNLHFTTHGWLQTQDADLSALVLSQIDANGRPRNGFLRASDIVRLDLPADLVVLSACETGLGKEIRGEGLVGLPQAFMAAGATRVLVSLWPVDDLASSILMGKFYHGYIAEGRSPAAALREAQITMWHSSRRAPFYWGAFELQGDWRPASPPR